MKTKNVSYIPLNKGLKATVDADDYKILSKYKWYHLKNRRAGYAMRHELVNGKNKIIYMHREILKITGDKYIVDHINNNGLDNRRSNIRKCTHAQNQWNKGMLKTNTSGYKGVQKVYRKSGSKFISYIRFKNKMIFVGTFDTAIEAAKAYDTSARKLHKEFSKTNFSVI